jgi:hypothetical protein
MGNLMITRTIREALEAEDEDGMAASQHLYIFRDGDLVFYVGRSAQPFERLQQHLGQSETWVTPPDMLGKLILNNLPESLDWNMDVITLKEIQEVYASKKVSFIPSIEIAEGEMIAHCKPCLNHTENRRPTPLPDRYLKRRAISNDGIKL